MVEAGGERLKLDARQAAVLRAMVTAYIGEAAPIGSATLSHLLPMSLSPASIRATLAELTRLGLTEQPHASAGRIPTERGLRIFVDALLDPADLGAYERRAIAYSVDEAATDSVLHVASQLLSERTHQLGFVITPRLDRVVLQHVSLVRLTTDRVLVVLVSQSGEAHRRLVDDTFGSDQAELDRIATMLNERVVGRTLPEVRAVLEREARLLRRRADRLLSRAIDLGVRALACDDGEAVDLVIETRLALLDQPEFRDPRRIRDLFSAVETKERLLEVIDQMLGDEGVSVAFGEEVDEPALRRCAVVATRYGGRRPGERGSLGVLGVIGPSRMDYGRVIPLVRFLSQVMTERLSG
jgi:heat-inducible transcriptional repressor